jgi:acyl carrier protein
MGLDSVEIILAVEQEFELDIPDAEAARMITVGDLQAFVVVELRRLGRTGVDADAIFERLRAIICRQLGVPPDAVMPTARFVKDLGVD